MKQHVIPGNDLKPHSNIGTGCKCQPQIREGGCLIVHNSFDGREFWEEDVSYTEYCPKCERPIVWQGSENMTWRYAQYRGKVSKLHPKCWEEFSDEVRTGDQYEPDDSDVSDSLLYPFGRPA